MGYLTTLSGELQILPSLTWAEIRGSNFLDFKTEDGSSVLKIDVLEVEIETKHGTLTQKTGVAVVPLKDSVRAYDILSDLEKIVKAFPGHRFIGCIEGEGENQGDAWRLYVRHGQVIEHTISTAWPAEPLPDDDRGDENDAP